LATVTYVRAGIVEELDIDFKDKVVIDYKGESYYGTVTTQPRGCSYFEVTLSPKETANGKRPIIEHYGGLEQTTSDAGYGKSYVLQTGRDNVKVMCTHTMSIRRMTEEELAAWDL